MLGNGFGNADLTDGDTQRLHQFQGILIGTIGGSETRHRDTNNALAVNIKFVESFHRHEQSQCGIESTTDANHGLLGIDMVETLNETSHLDIQDFLAGGLHVVVFRNKRMGIDITRQNKVAWRDMLESCLKSMGTSLGIDERSVLTTLSTQFLDVDLT